MKYNWKTIIIIVLLILIIYIYLSNTENFVSTTESISNISSMYNSETITATNLNATNNISAINNKFIVDASGLRYNNNFNVDTSGNVTINGTINNKSIDNNTIKGADMRLFLPGCIIGSANLDYMKTNPYVSNSGAYQSLYVGFYNFYQLADKQMDDIIDYFIVNPGFMCKLCQDGITGGNSIQVWNISPKPIRIECPSSSMSSFSSSLILPDLISKYYATESDYFAYSTVSNLIKITVTGQIPKINNISSVEVLMCDSITQDFLA
jgi:hypothetical protein